ncbi:unnamed protein product [Arabis nemorensis]|uniref:Uncharacterized protein n=1 Tax=Arabis nemorensis TaxID=586526 RepID=A0A565AV44_9BRAS|nr:unnamed protein product [Arabis nemorensis]
MESVSAINQTLPNSGDETEKFTVYSAAVHKVIVWVNTGIIGLLQLTNQQNSSVFQTHKTEFLCFYIFVFFYAVLRVREAMHVRLRPGVVKRIFGHTSHLFGALAALVLVSVVCATFAFVLLLLWFLWLSLVAYDTFNEIKLTFSEAPQPSPV